nr:hypothetical protein [uncultured Roseobacter sp.]
MLPNSLFKIVTSLSGILQDLDSMGIQVEVGDDFARYRAYRSQQTDRGAIYPMFDVASSYIDRTNGFWICGFDPDGELIHTQAVRLFDLSDASLATHLNDHRHKYITPDTTPDPDLTFFSGPEALHTISGQVCYQGDFWLRANGLGGPRSQGATELLSRILFEIMVGAWNPSFVFALVPKRLGAKGAHLRYGYTHCELGRWLGPDQQVTEEEYLIWMGAKDMANMLQPASERLGRAANMSAVRSPTPIDTKSHRDAGADV